MEKLSGQIERITFHNTENGFCVLKVKVSDKKNLITVLGNLPSVTTGEYIEAEGEWETNKYHGSQFKTKHMQCCHPNTVYGMEKYLGSGLIKGIGPVFAKKIIDYFGKESFDIIENTPEKLLEVTGIGENKKDIITAEWQDQKIIRKIMVFLQSHGIGASKAVKIYKTYGEKAIDIVNQNPYTLAQDIRGIGFRSADQIAQNLGIDIHSLIRARAGINFVLKQITSNGHCAYPVYDLIKQAKKLLNIPEDIIRQAIEKEINNNQLILTTVDNIDLIYLRELYLAENSLAKTLRDLKHGPVPILENKSEKHIKWIIDNTELTLAESQKNAIKTAITNKISVITGGPGVGKTTIINCILKIFTKKHFKCTLCAPTGRAAKRLSETSGMTAKTIHRVLEYNPITSNFNYNKENTLDNDIFIIDECSMVDLVLMNKLLSAIPAHGIIIFVGDVDQLPSVGPGNVLADIINSEIIPVAKLTEIFRQAAESKIITTAHTFNQGHLPELDNNIENDFFFIETNSTENILKEILSLTSKRIPEKFGYTDIKDIQILTPMHKSIIGVQNLNTELQKLLNTKKDQEEIKCFGNIFRTGDKIMQTQNNYTKDVFNGDLGIITNIDKAEETLAVSFDNKIIDYAFNELDELTLAYAITIHKSQGSEYPVIIIPVHTQHYIMLKKNLIYTAITRGKKLVILIGQTKALKISLKNSKTDIRYGSLEKQLRNANLEFEIS